LVTQTEVKSCCEKITLGADSVEFATTFFDKLASIERSYSEALTSLCDSRYAKLTRLFGNSTTEHIPSVP